MKSAITLKEARDYLLSQPFVEGIGIGDVLRFNPYAMNINPTLLDKTNREIGKNREKDLEKISDGCEVLGSLAGLFNREEGSLDIHLDTEYNLDTFEMGNLETACLNLHPGLGDIFESGFYLSHPEEFSRIYIDYLTRQDIALKLHKEYGLFLPTDGSTGSGLNVLTPQIEKVEDLNPLLDFGMAYTDLIYKPKMQKRVEKISGKLMEAISRTYDKLRETE
ncbi:hypothetical protein CMI42_05230 [Candidatus Pacearchaeota archaeon]|nr:hypothetical protein [Candidatus Pacearchaeota archaeon]